MGGKSKPDNSAVVNEQKAQAAQEAQKEADRQARIQKGLGSIKQAFEGSPVMKSTTSPYDWSGFKPGAGVTPASGAPAGYTAVRIPATTTATPAATTSGGRTISPAQLDPARYNSPSASERQLADNPYAVGGAGRGVLPTPNNMSAASSGATAWGLQDASGKIYKPGDEIDITSQTPTGETSGGFDDAFYNKYKQGVLDYYMPQVDKQYSDAKKQATYGLARSGNLLSSAANTLTSDLATQNDVNTAGVRNQADTAAGDLRSQVNTERQKATSQLYATEDPEVAAQQSLAAVRDISLSQPQMSPLSALFNVATIGGANILKGYQGQQNLNTFNTALPSSNRSSTIVR